MSAEPSYQVGYEDGKNKAFFEMAEWRPERHGTGCGCEPCLTGSVVARHLAGLWIIEVIYVAIAGRLSDEQALQLQEAHLWVGRGEGVAGRRRLGSGNY